MAKKIQKKKKRIPTMQTSNARFNVTKDYPDKYTITVFGNDEVGRLKNVYKIKMSFFEIFHWKNIIKEMLEGKQEFINAEIDQLKDAAYDIKSVATKYEDSKK